MEQILKHSDMQPELVEPLSLTADYLTLKSVLAEEQWVDPTLGPFKRAEDGACFVPVLSKEAYNIQNNILYRQ